MICVVICVHSQLVLNPLLKSAASQSHNFPKLKLPMLIVKQAGVSDAGKNFSAIQLKDIK